MVFQEACRKITFFRNKILNEFEFATGKIRLRSKPVWLQLDLSTKCNINCLMCRTPEENSAYGKFIDFMVFENIYRSGWLNYVNLLELGGWGETFLYPDIELVLKKCSEFKNTKIQITTNGLLLNREELIDILCGLPKINLIFSIDSAHKVDYEKIRRGASWDILINNINNLNKKREKNRLTTECHCLVNRLNVNYLKDMVDFALIHKFNHLGFMRLHDYEQLEVSDEIALPAIFEALKYARSKNLSCSGYGKFKTDNEISARGAWRKVWRCIRPWQNIMILGNGNVCPCCFLANENCGAIMGNLTKQSLPEIWNSDLYVRLRKSAFAGYPEFCNNKLKGCKAKNKFIPNVIAF